MNLSGISIKRPVAVSMVVLGILLLGFVSLQKIPLNLLPDITYPKITVRTEYPHAAPREVEERVTKDIESIVGIINNVVKVSSVSRPGWSDVFVEFNWGTNADIIAMDIREKVQLLENVLPEEVEKPIILRYDPNQDPIMTLAVGGETDMSTLRRWVEMNIELELERLDGVAAVKVEGGYQDEILIELDEAKLISYGLRISSIANRLERENINIAGGSLEDAGNKLAVRTLNRYAQIEDIKEMIVSESTALDVSSASSSGNSSMSLGGSSGMPAGLGSLLAGMGGLSSSFTQSDSGAGEKQKNAVIRLKDVAKVSYQHKERSEIARLEENECIKVSVFKEGDANIVTVAKDVHDTIEEIKQKHRTKPRSKEWTMKLYSPGRAFKRLVNGASNLLFTYRPFMIEEEPVELDKKINIEVISDQSVFISQSIYSVAQTAIWGALFAIIVLYLFLRNMSSTLIVGVAIPVSIIATFNAMFFMDISFNIMSLGGLALGVGMLVDNSIVVLENILRWRGFEPDPALSAYKGTEEVSSAITASTLTNIMVFAPILYLEGMFRQIFGDLAWTVAFGLICSELVALSIVPMLTFVMGNRVKLPKELMDELDEGTVKIKRDDEKKISDKEDKPPSIFSPLRLFDFGFNKFKAWYPGLLRGLLKMPVLVAGSAVLVAGLSSGIVYLIGWELLPPVDQGEFMVRVELPSGTPIETTNERIAGMERIIRDIEHSDIITAVFATVGISAGEGQGGEEKSENLGEIHVSIVDRDFRDVKDETVIDEVMQKLSGEVGLRSLRSAKPQLLSYKTPIQIEIESNNLDKLKAASDLVVLELTKEVVIDGKKQHAVRGLTEVESSMGERNPEVNITIDRERAAAFGISVSEITDVVRQKVKGEEAGRFDAPDEQIDIRIQLKEEDRATLEKLKRISIPGTDGDIMLEQLAVIEKGEGPATITRSENSRVALIRANLHERPLGDVVKDIRNILEKTELPSGCIWRITGQSEEMDRSISSLYLAAALAILLVYIVLASQFESIVHPFVIMFCVPFSLVGLALILLATGQTINIFALIGMLMMVGIAVNDAIVLVTTINQRRDDGMERVEAIVEAGRSRLRPIMITTLTTTLGMVPMAIALGPGSELRAPMAITVIGGLLSSTFFTLTAIPCIYLLLDKIVPRSYKKGRSGPDKVSSPKCEA